MNYNNFFKKELTKLKDEGNYRTFADLEKIAEIFLKLTIIVIIRYLKLQCGVVMIIWE